MKKDKKENIERADKLVKDTLTNLDVDEEGRYLVIVNSNIIDRTSDFSQALASLNAAASPDNESQKILNLRVSTDNLVKYL